MASWSSSDISPQHGRTAVVTGTGGLGLETALALARAGADVIIAGRHPGKGVDAVAHVRRHVPDARPRYEPLDLASLASIGDFVSRLGRHTSCVDLLINNAAVMTSPQRRTTADGYELQFGTNYLGHFALTARLLPLLRRARRPRVVTLSSVAARSGTIDFDDLQAERRYRPMPAYGQSKLACLMFALELQRRSDAAGWGLASIPAHPGIARTDLIPNGARPASAAGLARRFLWFMFQPAAQGALPTLYAATAEAARGGVYYGPECLGETRGAPAVAKIPRQALDAKAAARLWSVSARLAGVDPQ